MGLVRIELRLTSEAEWSEIFDRRMDTVFVRTEQRFDDGVHLRIDLDVRGWLVTLRGTVVGMRDDPSKPSGVIVALARTERDKVQYLDGFARGGILNLREKRRLPIRLAVTYGAIEGPTTTVTKDINEEGVFLFTDHPLAETSLVHMLLTIPGRAQPISLAGKVTHTITADDEEPPGMGIVFELDEVQRETLTAVIDDLEQQLRSGTLPTTALD